MANKCSWWHFYSALFHLRLYQISYVCLALIYMEPKHMVYGEFYIYHYLVLDQKANDNDYSTPLRHEVCNMNHKKVMTGIDFCYNKFSHISVQHQHYSEPDTVCLFFFIDYLLFFPDQTHHFCGAIFSDGVEIP